MSLTMKTMLSGDVLRMTTVLAAASLLAVSGCSKPGEESAAKEHSHGEEPAEAPTNRVEIPGPVRTNLGITFAKVEKRNVARTLRIPGRFELLPTATREYRTHLDGRIELLVSQYQRVEAGQALYKLASPTWRDLLEEITAAQAAVDSMQPLREAHRVHEESLKDKVKLWEERLKQLEELRTAGGGSASLFTEARATLNATQAELADVMEKDAELQAQQVRAESQLRAVLARRDQIIAASGAGGTDDAKQLHEITVRASTAGVVESLSVTTGGLVEDGGLVMTLVQPELIRFRAQALQGDLGGLHAGLGARIAPPQGAGQNLNSAVEAAIELAPIANADQRTIDVLAHPVINAAGALWARPGVLAHLEVTLAGGHEELAIPRSAVVQDGATPIIFRRDPSNPDRAIRMTADIGLSDGTWVVIQSGVKAGDEIIVDGSYQLMLATSGSSAKGGHFHADGTFHEGED
jgi:multidrug efflux pump subunit AcrA (membrane-fusion protein)